MFPDAKTELENWQNPIQFMVSVILSAQATDKGVNKITPILFERYKTVEDFANENEENIAKLISSINFYNMKAKRIKAACNYIINNYKGELPSNINELVKIPGIGRKSANVIIFEALKCPAQGIVVDTHMTRVSNRLGFTEYNDQKDAEKIEQDLLKIIPKNEWETFSKSAVLLGRYICKARKPKCSECLLNKICPSSNIE